MSDFPKVEEFSLVQSERFLKRLPEPSIFPFVIRREKDQYLYDLDGNKYTDFYLNNGAMLLGHNSPQVSRMVKDSLTLGFSGGFIYKNRLILEKTLKSLIPEAEASVFPSEMEGLAALLNKNNGTIGVNTEYLRSLIGRYFSFYSVERAQKDKNYDILFFEPADLDENLEDSDFTSFQAEKRYWVLSRTAYRFSRHWNDYFKTADGIFCSGILFSGLEASVLFSKDKFSSGKITGFQAAALAETIRLFKTKLPFTEFPKIRHPQIIQQKGSLFLMKNPVCSSDLLPYGVFLSGKTGFLSIYHTYHDIRRLYKALDSLPEA